MNSNNNDPDPPPMPPLPPPNNLIGLKRLTSGNVENNMYYLVSSKLHGEEQFSYKLVLVAYKINATKLVTCYIKKIDNGANEWQDFGDGIRSSFSFANMDRDIQDDSSTFFYNIPGGGGGYKSTRRNKSRRRNKISRRNKSSRL
jgi:hypothetical protein